MPEEEVGRVSDFFARPVVAGIDLTAPLKVGDRIHILGHTTDMEVVIESMQVQNISLTSAKAGDAVGINFDDPAEIKSARLAKVNEDHFSIMVPENELVHSYPYSHIISIVEGVEGVPIDASDETPTYPVVIRVYHLNVKKKWGFI